VVVSTSVGGSRIPVALSTASCYPDSTATAFETASRLGYDGVEVMVWTDPVSQDINAIRRLSDHHGIPILAVHAPCLLITQRVWGSDPWGKLQRAKKCAETVGARTVVVHPPFRWQRDYARDFVTGVAKMSEETDVVFAVENMFPLRGAGQTIIPYAPDWSPVEHDYGHVTLDLSHTAVSQSNALQMATALGHRLAHVHMADGIGTSKDEHLVPGRGTQPCGPLLDRLRRDSYNGVVVVEINTRRCVDRAERETDLAEALAFTRLHLSEEAALDTSTWQRDFLKDFRGVNDPLEASA
jgi:sugar phosphate isomerase/epimerase